MAIAPKSLLFMRRYDVADLCWGGFLAIFYKIEVWTKIARTRSHSTQIINIHEKTLGHGFPLGFSSNILKHFQHNGILKLIAFTGLFMKSNTLYSRTHGHSTQDLYEQ